MATLHDVMCGKVKDIQEIVSVLKTVSDEEFVDALNYLDATTARAVALELPEKKNLVDAYAKVDAMSRKIHTENEFFEVSAEEYVKNSENLEKWKVDLKGKDFAEAREVVDWLNVSDEEKRLLMDTAVMKVKEESRNVENLTEEQYKAAINFEIQSAVYQTTVATAIVNSDKNPKIATQEAVMKFVEAGRKQAENLKKAGKSSVGFLNASVDSILAYSASTNEWINHRLEQAKNQFASTKLGSKVAEITDKASKKLAIWDKKLCEHKKWGKTYTYMKKYAPVVASVSRSMAVNMGMLTLASMTGPAGAALYAAYAIKTSCKPLIGEYKKAKANDPKLNFVAYAGDNKWSVAKSAFTAVNMVVSGLAGYGALVGANNYWTARVTVAGVAMGLNAKVNFEQDKKNVAQMQAKGETPEKQPSFMRSLGKAAVTTAVSFGFGWLARNASDWFNTNNESKNIESPEETAKRLQRTQGLLATQQGDSLKVTLVEEAPAVAEQASSADDEYKAALGLLKEDCSPAKPQVEVTASENDCEEKIKIQESAEDNQELRNWWQGRAEKFIEDCNDRNAINALIFCGVFKLDDMPGINSEQEFMYKYGLMKKMNLPHQRDLVEAIEEKIKAAQDIVANGGDETAQIKALKELHFAPDQDGNPAMAQEIANGMNSYDNRGNYLCAEPKPVVEVKEETIEPKEENTGKPKEERAIEVKEVVVPKLSDEFSFAEGEQYMQEQVVVMQDYDHKEPVEVTGEAIESKLEYFDEKNNPTGEYIDFKFKDGILEVESAKLIVNDEVKQLAEHLNGFPDVSNPEEEALKIVARKEFMIFLKSVSLNNPEALENVVGLDAWQDNFSAYLGAHEIEYGSDEENVNELPQLVLDSEAKSKAIENMNEENRKLATQKNAEEVKNFKRGMGMDY